MTASTSAQGPGSVDDPAVLRGEVQATKCVEKPVESGQPFSKPTTANDAQNSTDDDKAKPAYHTNSCVNLKLKELAKRQRKRIKELSKTLAEKSKCPEKAVEAMYQTAVTAINNQFTVARNEVELEAAKKEALEALATKHAELAQSRNLVARLKDLCRELQSQSNQFACDNEKIRHEEARKRQESADQVSTMLEQVTERLNKQSEDVAATNQENSELRAQLTKVSEVLTLSEEIRSKYEAECTRLGKEAQAQKGLAENSFKQLQESERRSITYAQRVLELQEAMQKASEAIKSCHATNVQLSDDKKEMSALNHTMREEYTKATSLLSYALEESRAKDSKIQKLQLALARLEGLCRCLQQRARSHEGTTGEGATASPASQHGASKEDGPGLAEAVQVTLDCTENAVKLGLSVQ